ncbi:E3 ubiquitin- ligase rbrA protein [Rutstroemia sp. NJR-2017a BBW]|nr:E3 ubiquitin- ligase rbrA protein [Rutstroemia sp. NJR-2017a BBW]
MTFKQSVDLLHGGKKLMILYGALDVRLDSTMRERACNRLSNATYATRAFASTIKFLGTKVYPVKNTRFSLVPSSRFCKKHIEIIYGYTGANRKSLELTSTYPIKLKTRNFRAEQMLDRSRRDEESASIAKIKETTKLCPGCSCPIEKNNGCDHMRCKSFLYASRCLSFAVLFLQSRSRQKDLESQLWSIFLATFHCRDS